MILNENFLSSVLTVRKSCWERWRCRRIQACVASLLRRHVLLHEERGENDGAVEAEHSQCVRAMEQKIPLLVDAHLTRIHRELIGVHGLDLVERVVVVLHPAG